MLKKAAHPSQIHLKRGPSTKKYTPCTGIGPTVTASSSSVMVRGKKEEDILLDTFAAIDVFIMIIIVRKGNHNFSIGELDSIIDDNCFAVTAALDESLVPA